MKEQIERVLRHYFDEPVFDLDDVPFGLTNVTRIVAIDGQRYVVRLYNRHTKTEAGLHAERGLTSFLSESGLSVDVPAFLRTREGAYYVRLSDGTLAAITTFLEGSAPALENEAQAEAYGSVLGEVAQAMAGCETELAGASFLDHYNLHPLADQSRVEAFMANPPFPLSPEDVACYKEALSEVTDKRERLRLLPMQAVHHDMLVFNLLAHGGSISGVLDFDLASTDVAAMEFAIGLNHVLQIGGGSLGMASAFIRGYARHGSITRDELKQLRTLTRAYHVAVLHFYIGQHAAGNDIAFPFGYILRQTAERDEWLARHGSEIQELAEALL